MNVAQQRQMRRNRALIAQYDARVDKPMTRKQAQAWLSPIRKALNTMLHTGEAETVRGYAVTKMPWDIEYARTDYCIAGFTGLIERAMPDVCMETFERVRRKLANGHLLERDELIDCLQTLKEVEERLLTISHKEIKQHAQTEMLAIEFQRMGVLS